MDDLIRRRDVIEHLKKRLYETELNSTAEHPYYEEIADNRVDIWMNELPSAQPENVNAVLLKRAINAGIVVTNKPDLYSCGMRNGMRWCRAFLEDEYPKFEDASKFAQPEIIHCKECRYKELKGVDYYCDHITGEEIMVSPKDYCSWAERGTDG